MSEHRHQHRRKRKNPINEFFDRLRGKKGQKSYHRSEFPGINLPKDYDPIAWRDQSKTASRATRMEDDEEGDLPAGMPETRPVQSSATAGPEPAPGPSSSKKKRSLSDRFELFMKKQELKKEERYKNKLRKKHRRKSEREFSKINKGPGLGKRLFNLGEEAGDAEKEKKIPLFSQRNPVYRNAMIMLNSLMVFIATYILTYLFYWVTSLVVASFYGLDSTLYFYDLKFNDHSPLWNRLNILVVTGIPPFLCLVLALFLFQYVFKIPRFAGLQKLFILWSAFHLFNHFFGAFPSGIVTDEGFGYVAAWLYLNTAFKFMFSLVSLFILGAIGFFSAKHMLETSDSQHRIKGDARLSFLLFQFALPWFVGTIIMLLLRIPKNFDFPYETLMFFTMAFLVFPAFFNEKVKPELNLLKIKRRRTINLGYLFMAVALIAFLRIMLGIGLHFIIEINISVSPAVT